MADATFIAINSEALLAKSKVYMSRAMASKGDDELDEYQLWASLALELLGKAALASKHPSLIVDPTHWPSMFVAAGIKITTDVKTITAKTLFERLTHLAPRFDKSVQDFCMRIAERRNAELHSGDLPFKTMRLDAWEAKYWHAADIVLRFLGSSLEEWLGAADAAAPRQILDEAFAALESSVKEQVKAATANAKAMKKGERDPRIGQAEALDPEDAGPLFDQAHDHIWRETCPACANPAFMAGEQSGETISHESEEYAMWEIVDREFVGEAFVCLVCKLSLSSSDELTAADLNYIHNDTVEREMEYEPEYGND